MSEHFDTDTLSLGRFTPRTPAQRTEALSGIAQCNRDVSAGDLTTSDDMIRQGRSPYWRAGYELRWHELMEDSRTSRIPRPNRWPVVVPRPCAEGCGGTVAGGRHSADVDYCYALSQQAKADAGQPLD